ncbi:MAG: sulfatase, partial [Bacteroidales bacterium]|nr:sulfatase [Bacteroidales bacterium]
MVNNRYFFFIIFLVSVIFTGCSEKKNVLFLMADDFNYWTSKNGYYPHAQTPNLDKLANKGVFFKDAHCSSPVCEPSRNALWSGLRPSTTCLDENGDGYVRTQPGFENIVTMNQYFKENGYYVYGVGKLYHPGSMQNGKEEIDYENWSELNHTRSGCKGGKLYKFRLKSKKNYAWSANDEAISEDNCGDYKIANDVAEFLKNYKNSAHKDQPFFLGCGLFRPHMPWNSPIEFWNQFNIDSLTIPKGYNAAIDTPGNKIHREVVQHDKWMQAIHGYLASCALADYNIGIIMDALEKSGLAKNTIVLFMGDHGWNLGEKGRWGKYAVCDEANHTSLIIYDPSAKGNGRECSYPVSLQDIYPTLVDICDLPPKTNIEGNSLFPLLSNPTDDSWNHPIVMTFSGVNYIKTREWRFVDNGKKSQLHNNYSDPYQWKNLYGDDNYKETKNMLLGQMDSIIKIGYNIRDAYPGTKGHYDEGCDAHNKTKDTLALFPINGINNTITIDLEKSNPVVNVSIFNHQGEQLSNEFIAGEEKVTIEFENSLPKG